MSNQKFFSTFYQKQEKLNNNNNNNKHAQIESSSIAFISLLENSFGVIKKANQTFLNSLGFTPQMIGQSILQVLPSNILEKKLYSKVIQQIAQDLISNKNNIIEIPLFVIRNNQGFSQPFQVKLQSQSVNSEDFGLAIQANFIHDDQIYNVLDYQDPSIIKIMSKQFKEEFIIENFGEQNLNVIRMDSFVPIINDLVKLTELQQIKKIETIMIKPLTKTEALMKPNLRDQNFLNSLIDSQMYLITVSFQVINTKLAQFVNMVIESYSQVNSMNNKINCINLYQKQIKDITGIELKFDQNYKNNLKQEVSQITFDQLDLPQDDNKNYIKFKLQNERNESTTYIQQYQNSTINNISRLIEYNDFNELSKCQTKVSFIDVQPESIDKDKQTNQQNLLFQNFNLEQRQYCNSQAKTENQINFCYNDKKEFSQSDQRVDFIQKLNSFNEFNTNEINLFNDKKVENSNNNLLINFFSSGNTLDYDGNINKIYFENQNIIKQDFINQNQNACSNKINKQSGQIKSKQSVDNQQLQLKNETKLAKKPKKMFFSFIDNYKQINQEIQSVTSSTKSVQNKYINWIYMVNVQFSYALSERNIILLNRYQMLSTPTSQNEAFIEILSEQNNSRISLSKQYLRLLYNNTNPNIEIIQFFNAVFYDDVDLWNILFCLRKRFNGNNQTIK
ncbi:transmembrane protein, putative (macronuclear) [Tetrahymena thermophila SB210]|uniref:Transmembrane protein, putative n=1 Tax=Tetrahymena thermophila (strain SB210) TaxID=312017 RepID=Q22QQ9_TETTS|nr:transmembrane protein, putative [Tetrahymena thermophila SB210]EAR87613.2 transmembrane protein, putative [Tetrahymena thermophila SB210]|eukprot:XP_001007858.2 transmembrane protein, putative [Tetrahymena thermophila SB210]